MRINVYHEEVTGETQLMERVADTGLKFAAARIFLASPDVLEHTEEDDDRSAITFFWATDKQAKELEQVFKKLGSLIAEWRYNHHFERNH